MIQAELEQAGIDGSIPIALGIDILNKIYFVIGAAMDTRLDKNKLLNVGDSIYRYCTRGRISTPCFYVGPSIRD